MPDTKITALTALTAADPANDVLPIVDVSDTTMAASGTTKKISINNVLGASGTATLASATITGDLTVDTSTLKVDSANNRVGINTASPAVTLDVNGASNLNGNITIANGGSPFGTMFVTGSALELQANSNSTNGLSLKTTSTTPIIFSVNSAEAMRLNSTGLGVGGSPTRKLSIVGSGATYANINSGDNTSLVGLLLGGTSTPSAGQLIYDNTANSLSLFTSGSSRFLIDSSGNVGIGVTPSAWVAGAKALQFGAYGSLAQSSSGNIELSFNSYNSGAGAYKYLQTDTASLYRASSVHSWFVAPSGTAGNAISFTQAMTLESTGSLVLGAAAVATTATDGFLYIPGCAGTPTGTPTAKTGRVPLVVDTTNNKLYFYSGGAWVAAN